jgi:peptidoglycan/LPS O-acetylase OafA/YrhL
MVLSESQTKPLTSYRFIAALGVVLFHCHDRVDLSPTLLDRLGPSMVTFFFVLSGFILTVVNDRSHAFKPRRFWVNRFARIAPLYYLALLVSIYFVFGHTATEGLAALLLDVTFLQAWSHKYALSLNGPGWSLSVEAFFYAIFPICLLVFRRLKRPLVWAMALWLISQLCIGGILAYGRQASSQELTHFLVCYLPLLHLCSFCLGVGGGTWIQRLDTQVELSTVRYVLGALLILSSLVFAWRFIPVAEQPTGLPFATASSLLGPLFLALILITVLTGESATSVLRHPLAEYLGHASFAIYILQSPVQYAYFRVISPHIHMAPILDVLTYVLVLVAISCISFAIIETPARRFLRAFMTPRHRDLATVAPAT